MRVLAIDFGTKKLGLALSDPEGRFALPRGVMPREGEAEQMYAGLARLAAEERVGALVVGLPLGLDGAETATTRQARNFGNRLAARLALPVHFVDERLSSAEAKSRLAETGTRGKKAKARLDAEAAALILESFLAARRAAAPAAPVGDGPDGEDAP